MSASKEIQLSRGRVAIVDKSDYDRIVSLGKWTFHNMGYAYRFDRSVNPKKCLLMHRVVNGTPEGLFTDHINGNRLDNRKGNLRTVTQAENNSNRTTARGFETSSHWSGYVVRVGHNNRRHYIGRFKTEADARAAYIKAKQEILH